MRTTKSQSAVARALVFSLATIIFSATASRVIPEFKEWHVSVSNGLTTGSTVVIHCMSKDDDLGERHLAPSEEFMWGFRENILHTTRFWCSVTKDESHAIFNVFWEDPLLFYKCDWKKCVWTARDDGVYLTDARKGIDILWIHWEAGC